MSKEKWQYYNHAVIPTTAPHEVVDTSEIESGEIWKKYPKALFARWTSDYDCGHETNWWWEIKDSPFSFDDIKSKRKYIIWNGNKNFIVKKINCYTYKKELYNIEKSAYEEWPEKYRPCLLEDDFYRNLYKWNVFTVYGAFDRETNILCGYATLIEKNNSYHLTMMRVIHKCEKKNINSALIYEILKDRESKIIKGYYICDGERNILHETNFQKYLEKYFCFRKAYCKLNIVYNPKIENLIKFLYHFRNILKLLDGIGFIHRINAVLKMEEVSRGKYAL